MDPNRARRLAEQFIERLLRFEREGDGGAALDDLVALFADDADIINPAVDLAEEGRVGRDEIRRFWQTYHGVLGRAESRFLRVTTADDAAGLFWTTHASAHDGSGITYDGATLLVFDDAGRIRCLRAYFDLEELSRKKASGNVATPADPRQRVSYG